MGLRAMRDADAGAGAGPHHRCMAHARRKFHELWANHSSQTAGEALKLFGVLYDVEREVQALDADQRRCIRQQQGRPAADALHAWLLAQRERVPEGSATARAINYSLGRWGALTRYFDDGHLPIDNNWAENQIRPIAIGRKTGCSPAACALANGLRPS
jgi:transposase